MPETLYSLLGVSIDCSTDDIKHAFRALARELHPDTVSAHDVALATATFIQIKSAYHVLVDPTSRSEYDATLPTAAVFAPPPPTVPQPQNMYPSSMGPPGADIKRELNLSLREALFGCLRTIHIRRILLCPDCKGTHTMPSCRRCGGEGTAHGEDVVDVIVPPGTVAGSVIEILGMGDSGTRDGSGSSFPGPAGNLLLRVVVEPSDISVSGMDIIYPFTINVFDALLGRTVELELLDGPAAITINPGTAHGMFLRIPSRGIPRDGAQRGDALLRVILFVPKDLSDKDSELLSNITPVEAPTIVIPQPPDLGLV